MSETPFPDIEIYLRDASAERVLEWLHQEFATSQMKTLREDHRVLQLELDTHDDTISVTLYFDAVPGYIVVWFDTSATRWTTDLDCARAAALHLGCEVRCSVGGSEDIDSEQWWRVEGEQVDQIIWR